MEFAYIEAYLSKTGLNKDLYAAMQTDDISDVIMAALNIMKINKIIPALKKELKSENKSSNYRQEGNNAYAAGKYEEALKGYNKALVYAPPNSRAMKLAYGNRSALLFKNKHFIACLNDIETCFAMNCPHDIIGKLQKRKAEASVLSLTENEEREVLKTPFINGFFQLGPDRNPQIPCATKDVGIVQEFDNPKIVAKKDIKVGTLVAVETAYVNCTDVSERFITCYYCTKRSMNLIPCDNCCLVLFCSRECKEHSIEEGHQIECEFIEVFDSVCFTKIDSLAFKAALKMKLTTQSWNELIKASNGLVNNKKEINTKDNNINNKFSLINNNITKEVVHGAMYNSAFCFATVLIYLESIPDFFPNSQEENFYAIQAFSRIMMHLRLNNTCTVLTPCVNGPEVFKILNKERGLFSFVSQLKHSCYSNTVAVGLKKKIALITTKPIKRGTELTLLKFGQAAFLNREIKKDSFYYTDLFLNCGVICDCPVPTDEEKFNAKLSTVQKASYQKLSLDKPLAHRNLPKFYFEVCKALALMSNVPHSEVYEEVRKMFICCIIYFQNIITTNISLPN